MHDKTIANEYPLVLPFNSFLKQDLGFVGHKPNNTIIEIPFKKPKNKELSFSQKIYNKLLSSTRIVVEHANSGVKRLRIVKDIVRIHDSWFRDTIISVACALHNFRTISENQHRKYATAA